MKQIFLIFLCIFSFSRQQEPESVPAVVPAAEPVPQQNPNLITFIPSIVINTIIEKYQHKIIEKLKEPIILEDKWVTDTLKVNWLTATITPPENLIKILLDEDTQTINVSAEDFDFDLHFQVKYRRNKLVQAPRITIRAYGTIISNELSIKLNLGTDSMPDVPKLEALHFADPIIRDDMVKFKLKFGIFGLSRLVKGNWFGIKTKIIAKINDVLSTRLTRVVNHLVFDKMYHAAPREIVYAKESIGISTRTMDGHARIYSHGIMIPWEGMVYPLNDQNHDESTGEKCIQESFEDHISN